MMTEQTSKSFAFAVDAGGRARPVEMSSVSVPSADGLVWAYIYLQDAVESRLADALNKNLYVVAIVSVIFLPLGFVTGLLGINVGGIPGADYSGSFAIVVGLLLLGAVAEYAFVKWKGWL